MIQNTAREAETNHQRNSKCQIQKNDFSREHKVVEINHQRHRITVWIVEKSLTSRAGWLISNGELEWSRDAERAQSDLEDWQKKEDNFLDATTRSNSQPTTLIDREDEISTFSLLAAAVILAAIQCVFLCVH